MFQLRWMPQIVPRQARLPGKRLFFSLRSEPDRVNCYCELTRLACSSLAIIVAWRATYRETVRWNKKRNPATAAGGKVTSRAIAPSLRPAVPADLGILPAVAAQERSATAVARSATLRARAPRRLAVGPGMAATPEVEVTAVSTAVGEEAAKRHATRAVG
ncbi:hypothetical protein EDB87DRAFT_502474 [Lactarius vividus]|nr:hypothetical protein EDB87DRAFT_502474 [Lactarius vividus]